MNAGLIKEVVEAGHVQIAALVLAMLIGLAGLSVKPAVHELLADAAPQPIADACQGSGNGC